MLASRASWIFRNGNWKFYEVCPLGKSKTGCTTKESVNSKQYIECYYNNYVFKSKKNRTTPCAVTLEDLVVTLFRSVAEISTWGGNKTAVDILVKEPKLRSVKDKLAGGLVNYDVIIRDVQEAIDQENPPGDDEDEDLENRQGR